MNARFNRLLWIGLALWLAGVALARAWGEWVFNPGSPALLGLFVLSAGLVWLLVGPLFDRLGVGAGESPRAVLWLAAVPMLLEIPAFFFHRLVFPNLDAANLPYYAACLFFFYGALLAAGMGKR